jgi:RHS repeat-associated protein
LLLKYGIDAGVFPSEQKSLDGMIHTDHLGTPHKMTDGFGAVVWSAYYKPFGAATITVSTIANNLRFPGQYFDAETGLNYNYYRDYNPNVGRHIEADPLGVKASKNLFGYAMNRPIMFSDPSGLLTCLTQVCTNGPTSEIKKTDISGWQLSFSNTLDPEYEEGSLGLPVFILQCYWNKKVKITYGYTRTCALSCWDKCGKQYNTTTQEYRTYDTTGVEHMRTERGFSAFYAIPSDDFYCQDYLNPNKQR